MAPRFHAVFNLDDGAIGSHHRGGSQGAHESVAILGLLAVGTVCLGNLAVRVGKQREVQRFIVGELRDLCWLVREIPSTEYPAPSRELMLSRKSQASMVQPGVAAFG